MGSRVEGAKPVYTAAAAWVDRGLRTDDSLFTRGESIWTSKSLDELRRQFLNRPDTPGDNVMDTLERQLEGTTAEACQLMGEVMYVHLLVPSDMKLETKQAQIEQVLGWSPETVTLPEELIAALDPGVADIGGGHNNRPYYLGCIIEFAAAWKRLRPDERRRRLEDPWAFKTLVMDLKFESRLFERGNSADLQRLALLHLIHPDTFEPIVSVNHKEKIAAKFEGLVENPEQDIDRKLQQIRAAWGGDDAEALDFYRDDIRSQWDDSKAPDGWGQLISRTQKHMASGKLKSVENDYKIEIGKRFERARAAVLETRSSWPDLVKDSVRKSENLIHGADKARFCGWIDEAPDKSHEALSLLWSDSDTPLSGQVREFMNVFPRSVISGVGTRTNIASVLLMGLGAERHPPFRTSLFEKAYKLTEHDVPSPDADEAATYDHALKFLGRFIDKAAEHDLELRRLDAQSAIFMFFKSEGEKPNGEPPPKTRPEPTSLKELAAALCLPVGFLERIERQLKRKWQVIFQGPPGTSKTYVAQELARWLAGSKERVTLVQFHPSYAYEDFVEGYRPHLENGQPTFTLKRGPLLRAAADADADPANTHVLVIDEINRGNVAKVFGELYFLLEYRDEDEDVHLQYSNEPMRLPKNLYIIGTMNTTDRSIALVDLALRRRFSFVEFHPDDEPIKGLLRRWLRRQGKADLECVADLLDEANALLQDDRNVAIGPSHFLEEDLSEEVVADIWNHNVLPYVEEALIGNPDRVREFDLDRLLDRLRRKAAGVPAPEPSDNSDDESNRR